MPSLNADDILLLINIYISASVSAAASVRASSLGASFSGACFLGIFCGSIVPILSGLYLCRERELYFGEAFTFIPIGAFFGSLLGIGFARVLKKKHAQLFFWLDSFAMALQGIILTVATPFYCTYTNPVALLFIGLFCGLAPGMLRDVLLGDVAMAVDQHWYAAALAVGCITAMAGQIWLTEKIGAVEANIVSFLAGVLVAVLLRRIFGYRLAET